MDDRINYGRRASSGLSRVTGIKSFFDTPSHSSIGLAKNIDDSVPTRMPISMVIAKAKALLGNS